MCILFGHNPQIIFRHFFHKMNLVIFCAQNEKILGILCMRHLLQFYADWLENLQVFKSGSEDVHLDWA